jgi:soluble lytic murein transglycosylase-like protein
MIRIALAALALILFSAPPAEAGRSRFPGQYDDAIKQAVRIWWPDYPHWLAWKAQLYQESRLDPAAVSPAGARGLAQFMPGTWRDMQRQLGLGTVSPHLAGPAITAGAYYMARLRRTWRRDRTPTQMQPLAQASYNAGTGHILTAQARCNGARQWPEIAPCLRLVTGERNSHETLTYVERIAQWRLMMEAGQ